MGRIVVLLDVERVVLNISPSYQKLNYSPLVVVYIAVVRGREDSDDCRELVEPVPLVHLVSLDLGLVGADNRYQPVPLQEAFRQFVAEVVGAATHLVGLKKMLAASVVTVDGVCPHQVAEEATAGNLPKPINFSDLVHLLISRCLQF